jgi:hypothetical protein
VRGHQRLLKERNGPADLDHASHELDRGAPGVGRRRDDDHVTGPFFSPDEVTTQNDALLYFTEDSVMLCDVSSAACICSGSCRSLT